MRPCGVVSKSAVAATLCALSVAAGGTMVAGVARGAMLFTGSYDAVLMEPGQPDQASIWNASSFCSLRGCSAHVVNRGGQSDWVFDGTQWTRLAIPQIGECNGATVPARSVHQTLMPRADGSLVGTLTSSVDCNGGTVDVSRSLVLTPS